MALRSPLTTLLRVRRIQEDLARAEVVAAQAKAVLAEENAASRESSCARSFPVAGGSTAFIASLVAGRSLAADAFAARRVVSDAQSEVGDRLVGWSTAAGRAEGVDRVVQRHDREARATEARAEAAERDDLASVAWRRRLEQAAHPEGRQ